MDEGSLLLLDFLFIRLARKIRFSNDRIGLIYYTTKIPLTYDRIGLIFAIPNVVFSEYICYTK